MTMTGGTEAERVRLGPALSLDEVAERLGWSDDELSTHLAERRRWTVDAAERFGL